MSLRNSLRHATELQVAPPKARNTQLSGLHHATDSATPAQQRAAVPGETLVFSATPPATGMQQEGLQACNSGQKLHVAFAKACNTQLGGLMAHRAAARLIATSVANPAKRLIQGPPISQLAALASSDATRAGNFRMASAINRCCNARGDDDANRAALIAECSALDAAGQADMLEHFNAEAERWERACRGGRP